MILHSGKGEVEGLFLLYQAVYAVAGLGGHDAYPETIEPNHSNMNTFEQKLDRVFAGAVPAKTKAIIRQYDRELRDIYHNRGGQHTPNFKRLYARLKELAVGGDELAIARLSGDY